MYREELTHYSNKLGKEMHMRIYGHSGLPFLAFPTQDSPCSNLEDFGMIDTLSDFLEAGRIRIFTVDSVDKESWSPKGGDLSWRAARQEQYYSYITKEVVPLILERTGGMLPLTTGMSMGANHALNHFLRRPDLFAGCLCLSGVYNSDYFFDGWMDSTLYMNSPERYLPNMAADHPYIDIYNQKDIIICIGQGAWEDGLGSQFFLQSVFEKKGINAWFDYWGFDVNHDWPWWKKQMRYFLPVLLEEHGL